MADHVQKMRATIILQGALEGPDRRVDVEIGRALGWRVALRSRWNWTGYMSGDGPPPGDEWCIRRDHRLDTPCDEVLPRFTFMARHDAQQIIDDA